MSYVWLCYISIVENDRRLTENTPPSVFRFNDLSQTLRFQNFFIEVKAKPDIYRKVGDLDLTTLSIQQENFQLNDQMNFVWFLLFSA